MTNVRDWQDRLLEDETIPSNAKFVGIILSRFFGKNKLIFPSLQTIGDLTSNSMNTVRKAIAILKETHYLVVTKEKIRHRGGFKNTYKLFLDGEQVSKNAISIDMLIDMSNDMSIDMLNDMLKTNTEYTEYIEDKLSKEKRYKKEIEKLKNEIEKLKKLKTIDIQKKQVYSKKEIKIDFIKNQDWKNLVQEWLDYKKREFRFSYKSEKTIQVFYDKLLSLSNGNLQNAKQIIGNSIANCYKGIFELKNKQLKKSITSSNDEVFKRFINKHQKKDNVKF